MHSLSKQIEAIEFLCARPVVAIALNHEGIEPAKVPQVCGEIAAETKLPVCDPLLDGVGKIIESVRPFLK
jgi:uncharacterized NAD-dependent epimerase/dehydratase family protein